MGYTNNFPETICPKVTESPSSHDGHPVDENVWPHTLTFKIKLEYKEIDYAIYNCHDVYGHTFHKSYTMFIPQGQPKF